MEVFADKLNQFLEENTTEDEDYGCLLQETLSFGVFYVYLNCENTEEVDWVVRKIKQLSLKQRDALEVED